MLLRNISYRYKLPLCMIFASAFTASIAIMVVSWQYYSETKSNLTIQSQELGNSMLNMLAWSLTHKDLWHAYSLLRGNNNLADNKEPFNENELITEKRIFILFDDQQTIFASNQPVRFPTGTHVSDLKIGSRYFLESLNTIVHSQQAKEIPTEQSMLSSLPLLVGNIVIGNLVISDSYESVSTLSRKISSQGILVVLITIGILTPIAWLLGKRIVNPLINLESCILKIGKEPIDQIQCSVSPNNDEIGRLSQHFNNMVEDLKKKSVLEKQVIKSDKLVAVGAVTAGMAHEINNPLAGMIIAVDTYKQYCRSSECVHRNAANAAIDLVERGLSQIQETVTALLVNVKLNKKPLSRVDVEDIYRLVEPESQQKSITFSWKNDIRDSLTIPSNSIRQILINLLLNAIHATHKQGLIDCHVRTDDGHLAITIKNNGTPMTEQQLERLFEPFYSNKHHGNGLGLWVSFQITQNLNGSIVAKCENQWTILEVRLPLPIIESTS